MPGLVPGIHAFLACKQGVDGRDKPGHDELEIIEKIYRPVLILVHSRFISRCVFWSWAVMR